MTRAVIFDLYGTLIHLDRVSGPYLRFARSVRPEDPWGLVRQSLLTETLGLRDFAARLGATLPDRLLAALDDDLRRDLESSRVDGEAADVLACLRRSGLLLGLISNAATPYKGPFSRHQLDRFFDAVVFSCDTGMAKPDPEIYRLAARQLGHPPEEIVMVGDSRGSDYHGPRGVGMGAVLLRKNADPAYRSVERLSDLPRTILPQAQPGEPA